MKKTPLLVGQTDGKENDDIKNPGKFALEFKQRTYS